MKIYLREIKQVKKAGTKTVWETINDHNEEIDIRIYGLLSDKRTMKSFRSMGGSEYAEMGYTCNGYKLVRLTSTSPNKERRIIREFDFISKL